MQAKGLLAIILSNSDEWRIYISELDKRSKNGRDAHRKAYKELQDRKYIRIIKHSNGRGVETHVFAQDKPIPDSYMEFIHNQITENPNSGKSVNR